MREKQAYHLANFASRSAQVIRSWNDHFSFVGECVLLRFCEKWDQEPHSEWERKNQSCRECGNLLAFPRCPWQSPLSKYESGTEDIRVSDILCFSWRKASWLWSRWWSAARPSRPQKDAKMLLGLKFVVFSNPKEYVILCDLFLCRSVIANPGRILRCFVTPEDWFWISIRENIQNLWQRKSPRQWLQRANDVSKFTFTIGLFVVPIFDFCRALLEKESQEEKEREKSSGPEVYLGDKFIKKGVPASKISVFERKVILSLLTYWVYGWCVYDQCNVTSDDWEITCLAPHRLIWLR